MYAVAKIPFTGDGTFKSDRVINGEVVGVSFDISGGGGAIDFDLHTRAGDGTGPPQSIVVVTNLAADAWIYPTAPVVDQVGAARLYAAGGTPVSARIPVSGYLEAIITGSSGNPGVVYVLYSC